MAYGIWADGLAYVQSCFFLLRRVVSLSILATVGIHGSIQEDP